MNPNLYSHIFSVKGFKIEGPSQAKIDVVKEPATGNMQVSYLPTAPGEYAVHVLVNNDDIPKSPFMADIKPLGAESPAGAPAASPAFDASKVSLNNCLIYKTSPLFFECSSNLKEYEIPYEACILTRC